MRLITRTCWLTLLVITGVMLAGFVTSNQDLISIRFWPTHNILRAKIWVFMLAAFGLGTITGATIFWLQTLSLKARLWSKAKQLSELEAHIEETEQQINDQRPSDHYGHQAQRLLASKRHSGN